MTAGDPHTLRDRVALVTGAGRGIGRAVAAALAGAGARVVLAARSRADIESLASDLVASRHEALASTCDVRDPAQVRTLVDGAVARFGALDILINSAGIFRVASVEETDDATWDAILDTNLKGAFLVTRAALPHLVARRGHVINMVSLAGRTVFRGNGAYCASKWGLLGFTNVLREEMRAHGLRVTALLPGAVDTPIWESAGGTWDRSRMMQPETVARLIVEICAQPPEASTDEVVLAPTGGEL